MVSLPITSFSFQRPRDGLPLLHSWLATLKAITFEGFETWREVLEIKVLTLASESSGIKGVQSVRAVKGIGRVSILLFAVLYTYRSLREKMEQDPALMADFGRLGGRFWKRTDASKRRHFWKSIST